MGKKTGDQVSIMTIYSYQQGYMGIWKDFFFPLFIIRDILQIINDIFTHKIYEISCIKPIYENMYKTLLYFFFKDIYKSMEDI